MNTLIASNRNISNVIDENNTTEIIGSSETNSSDSNSNLQQSQRLSANFRLSTTVPTNNNNCNDRPWKHYQQQYQLINNPSTSSNNNNLLNSYPCANSPNLESMTAAAAAVVTKFEPGNAASAMAAANASNGFATWPSVGATATEWDLAAAAASAMSRSGLDSRMISNPYYPNNYVASQYLSGQQQYNYLRGTSATTSFSNYPAINYGTFGYTTNNQNFVDYYNYYGNASSTSVQNGISNGSVIFPNNPSSTNGLTQDLTLRNASALSTNPYLNGTMPYYKNSNRSSIINEDLLESRSERLIRNSNSTGICNNNTSSNPINSIGPIKTEKQKRNKKKKSANCGTNSFGTHFGHSTTHHLNNAESDNTHVMVWELDELCNLASYRPKDNIVLRMENFVLEIVKQILSAAFLVDPFEDCDHTNVEDAEIDESIHEMYNQQQTSLNPASNSVKSESRNGSPNQNHVESSSTFLEAHNNSTNQNMLEGLRQIADKYKHIRGTYNRFKENVRDLLEFCPGNLGIVESLRDHDKRINNSHIERYRNCLKIITERASLVEFKCTNVVICNENLNTALAKLLTFDLAKYVPVENVYSYVKIGRETVFGRISERYKKLNLIIISSNHELISFAKKENIPPWPVNSIHDIDKFSFALETILLADITTTTTTGSQQTSQQLQTQHQIALEQTNYLNNIATN